MKKKNKLRVGFILDPVEQLDVSDDTSLLLFKEFKSSGHEVFYIKSNDIYISGGKLMVKLSYAEYDNNFDPLSIKCIKSESAESLDCILMRIEPPYNMSYFYLTHLLDLIKKKVFILNDPKGLREVSEKLFILRYPEMIPPTLVSKDIGILKKFVLSYGKAIVKQLNLYASKELIILEKSTKELHVHLKRATQDGTVYVMAQKYMEEIHKSGDKRILFLNGEILGAYKRIPKKNDYRSDPDFGGKNVLTTLSENEIKNCRRIAQDSLYSGIYFGGIDIIGKKLTEVNVTCPAGIIPLNKLLKKNFGKIIVSFVEEKINSMKKERANFMRY